MMGQPRACDLQGYHSTSPVRVNAKKNAACGKGGFRIFPAIANFFFGGRLGGALFLIMLKNHKKKVFRSLRKKSKNRLASFAPFLRTFYKPLYYNVMGLDARCDIPGDSSGKS
jgi:hypothetical protein